MLASEILKTINVVSEINANGFPHFSVFFPIDARLSAYRNKTHWAIMLESLVFNDGPSRHACCCTMIYCYGDALHNPPGASEPDLCVTEDGPSGALFDLKDVMGHLISSFATDMTIRGQVVPIMTDPAKYADVGIKLSEPPRVNGYELLRYLTPKYRPLFFLNDGEIAQRIGRSMPLLLRLYEWRHPDTIEGGERPADCESFQMIAKAIAANDPSLYRPTEQPNTHWRNWPMAGLL